jgi:hypothetical protein
MSNAWGGIEAMVSIIRSAVATVITLRRVKRDAAAWCDGAGVRAMTVVPGQKGTVGVEEVPDPNTEDGVLLIRRRAIGICGTDPEDIKVVVDLTV